MEDQIQEHVDIKLKWWSNFIIPAESKCYKVWQLFIGILSIFSSCSSLYFAAYDFPFLFNWDTFLNKFHSNPTEHIAMVMWVLIEFLYCLDIAFSFLHEYYSDEQINDKPISDIHKIAKHYLKGLFIFDFLAVFPFITIFDLDQGINLVTVGPSYRVEKIVYLLKTTRLKKATVVLGTKYVTLLIDQVQDWRFQQQMEYQKRNKTMYFDSRTDHNKIIAKLRCNYIFKIFRAAAILMMCSYIFGIFWYVISELEWYNLQDPDEPTSDPYFH